MHVATAGVSTCHHPPLLLSLSSRRTHPNQTTIVIALCVGRWHLVVGPFRSKQFLEPCVIRQSCPRNDVLLWIHLPW
jgi:hypothetical protein